MKPYKTTISVPYNIDLLDWLEGQEMFPKVYWKSEQEEIAAVGSILTFDKFPTFDKQTGDLRLFGGMSFSAYAGFDRSWDAFPRQLFFQPKLLLSKKQDSCTLTLYTLDQPSEAKLLEHYLQLREKKSGTLPKPQNRIDAPTSSEWKQKVTDYLTRIQNQQVDKLVSARKSTFVFGTHVDPIDMLKRLRAGALNTTIFGFQPNTTAAFVGATPEILYHRAEKNITTHALAGTRPRGKTPQEDLGLRNELLKSEKDQRELHYVREHLLFALSNLCDTFEFQKESAVLQNATLQHLVCNFSGVLQDGVQDRDIIQVLHPSPAVGGYPRKDALDLISNSEPFDRGWYAAPLGWIGPDAADLVVGIRSALIVQNQLHLFAGTGIVDGSCHAQEWHELDQKIGTFTRLWSD